MQIVDANGGAVALYAYDPWGKIMGITNGDGTTVNDTSIAKLNSLRYRGYCGDTETQWYYLQSRYYDPITRRFVNADSIAYTGQGIIGANMFAYCNNNPMIYSDPTGEIGGLVIGIGIGIIAEVVSLLTGCMSDEQRNWPDDCPYDYWGEGGGYHNDNCYGYVFDYYGWSLPGQYGFPQERSWNPETTNITYTRESMIRYVEADAVARERKVEYISTPDKLPEGALLVACKLTSDGKDFHFAVRLQNDVWLDKPGIGESRYNKINGFAKVWKIGECIYETDTIYFAFFRNR